MMLAEPYQKMLLDFLDTVPPLRAGFVRRWFFTRKGDITWYDIPECEMYADG